MKNLYSILYGWIVGTDSDLFITFYDACLFSDHSAVSNLQPLLPSTTSLLRRRLIRQLRQTICGPISLVILLLLSLHRFCANWLSIRHTIILRRPELSSSLTFWHTGLNSCILALLIWYTILSFTRFGHLFSAICLAQRRTILHCGV